MKFKLSLLQLLLFSSLGFAISVDDLPELKYEKFVLENGLTVIVHEDKKVPMVAVNVWYHVGSKNENLVKQVSHICLSI